MIKLKSLIEHKRIVDMEIDKNGGFNGYEDDTNMTDEEFEEFERYLQSWLNDIEDEKERERITKLTNKVLDVDSVITEFLLIDEETRKQNERYE